MADTKEYKTFNYEGISKLLISMCSDFDDMSLWIYDLEDKRVQGLESHISYNKPPWLITDTDNWDLMSEASVDIHMYIDRQKEIVEGLTKKNLVLGHRIQSLKTALTLMLGYVSDKTTQQYKDAETALLEASKAS